MTLGPTLTNIVEESEAPSEALSSTLSKEPSESPSEIMHHQRGTKRDY